MRRDDVESNAPPAVPRARARAVSPRFAASRCRGEFDPGRGYVKDGQGSVVAEMNKEGAIKDNAGQQIGKAEGFKFAQMATMAAYFLLVDKEMLRTRGLGLGRH